MMHGTFFPPLADGQNAAFTPNDSSMGSTPQAGTSSTSAAAPNFPHLNPRSCVTCRRRKVKCDKREPCGNCRKAHIECIFPAPGRAPRRPRKPPDTELLARLRKLEGVVQSLGQNVDDEPSANLNFNSPLGLSSSDRPDSSGGTPNTDATAEERHRSHADWAVDHHRTSLDKSFGRLVMNEGKTRYINNTFWASLNNEVEDLKAILTEHSDEEEQYSPTSGSPYSPQQGSHQGFVFQFSSTAADLASLHPSPHIIQQFWRIYEEQCDPLAKMTHRPTMKKQVEALKNNPSTAGKPMEAMLFSIYFAAITSMSDEECLTIAGEARPELIARYRFGVEQALARANILVTEELVTLQAMILFLLCLRRHEDARIIWSLSGVVTRIAISLGLHRDGSNFGLSPFDTEIRRRTWWQICVLDVRTSEDHGCDPSIVAHVFDTKIPLNIGDDDIWPSMTETPKETTGVTEMTFCLIRFHVAVTFRRLAYRSDKDDSDGVTLKDKERWIEECHKLMEEKFLRHCDMNVPMHWVICTVARLILAKMWLVIYHEFQRDETGGKLSPEIKDRLFITSLESIEYALLLETEVRAVKWGWLFRTYAQWHALAYLLTELCHRTTGPVVQRAWRIVDAVVLEWGSRDINPQKATLWRPIRKLLGRARAARAQALQTGSKNASSDALMTVGSKVPQSGPGTAPNNFQEPNFLVDSPGTADNSDNNQLYQNSFLNIPNPSCGQDTLDGSFANSTIPASPFFANQPLAQTDRFQFNANETNFLNNFYSESLDTPPQPSGSFDSAMAGLSPSGLQGSRGSSSQSPSGSGPQRSMSGPAQMPQQQQQQQPKLEMNLTDDPMLGGSDDVLQWDAFNDMIKEFHGNAGVGNAWQQRNTFGDTWL